MDYNTHCPASKTHTARGIRGQCASDLSALSAIRLATCWHAYSDWRDHKLDRK